jgi:hypothetical protein
VNDARAAWSAVITAIYPDGRRKIGAIMETVRICPVFGDDFSPGDEFSAQETAKSPSGEKLSTKTTRHRIAGRPNHAKPCRTGRDRPGNRNRNRELPPVPKARRQSRPGYVFSA